MTFLKFLQTVDRRFLYAMLLLSICIPFFYTPEIRVPIQPATRKMYDTIEELKPDSFVLFGVDWGAGTRGESRAQTEAIMRHLMKKHHRFAIMAIGEPQAKQLTQIIALKLQDEFNLKNTDFKYEQGVNWVNFGYKADPENYLKSWVKNIPGSIVSDIRGQSVAEMPVMKGVKTAGDIDLLLDITPTSSYESYIKFVQGSYNLKMGVAVTSVMGPEAFNRLDSNQIVGLVVGLQGGVEYEQLLDYKGAATRASISSSFAHLLIIGFIILGNVAMILERRQRARLDFGGNA